MINKFATYPPTGVHICTVTTLKRRTARDTATNDRPTLRPQTHTKKKGKVESLQITARLICFIHHRIAVHF